MCDTLCVRTSDAMLFAKNSDRHPDEPQVVEWHGPRSARGTLRTQYLTIPDAAAYGFLGSRPTWLWGLEHGVNEHGVAIGNEKVWTIDRPRDHPPALLGMDLVRLGLERGRSAEEALSVITQLLQEHGQGGSGEPHRDEPYYSSFLVADPHGGFIIETSNRTWAAREVGAGAAISNRISLTTDWERASPDVAPGSDFDTFRRPSMPAAIADERLAMTRATVARDSAVTASDLARMLRSHGFDRGDAQLPCAPDDSGHSFSVCMHRPEVHAQTTASMITELRAGAPPRAWVCLGNPCTSVYVPCFPPAIAPELADASVWSRFAALRERVQARPEELAEVRARLADVERDLWESAADAFTSGTRDRLDEFTRAAFAPVDAALHRLGV
jgi:dipeptidase